MPTRYLKPGICDSKNIDLLSAEAECLYYRLLVNVDDFGRLDARPLIIKAKCYPLREKLKSSKVEKWLKELATKGLANVYTCMDEPFLQINKWDNKPRASHSKFPCFDGECIQLYTDVPLTETGTKTVTETETAQSRFERFYGVYPVKQKKDATLKWFQKVSNKGVDVDMLITKVEEQRAIRESTTEFIPAWPAPVVWLNGKRWEDELSIPKPKNNNAPWQKVLDKIGSVPANEFPEFEDPLISKAIFKAGSWMEICRLTTKQLDFDFKPKFLDAYQSIGGAI